MKISVCIATHNGAPYVEAQLRSILAQIRETDEVIISDDGSADETLPKIKAICDPRIKIYEYRHKLKSLFPLDYATHNFVNALSHSTGDYIFLSDQDDIWLPQHVELMLKELSDSDLVICDCKIVDEKLKVLYDSKFQFQNVRNGILRNLWSNKCYQGSCMAFRRSVFQKALPFPDHYVGHDLWLGLIAEKFFKLKLLPIPLLLYRRRDESITFTGRKNTNNLWFKLHYRFFVVKEFLRKILVNKN